MCVPVHLMSVDTILKVRWTWRCHIRAQRKHSREFKVEAVRLVRERGVTVAQAGRDLDVTV